MRLVLGAVLVLGLASPAFAQVEAETPAELGALFCKALQSGDMSRIRAFISDELDLAIAHAEADSAVKQLEHPDEKPPLGDGVPWSSYPDRADECVVIHADGNSDPLPVALAHKFKRNPGANWQDELLVTGSGFELQIVDVRYSDGSTLTQFLADAVK